MHLCVVSVSLYVCKNIHKKMNVASVFHLAAVSLDHSSPKEFLIIYTGGNFSSICIVKRCYAYICSDQFRVYLRIYL